MIPFLGEILAGGAMFGNALLQRETNSQNKDLTREQMKWQQGLSDTAHQREVADLKAAGLNPELSGGGNGASTPSGGAPNLQAPQIANPLDMVMQVVNADQNQQRINIDKNNSVAAIAKTLSDTDLNKMRKIMMQKGMIRAELEGTGASMLNDVLKWLKQSGRKANPKMMNPMLQNPSFDKAADPNFMPGMP